MEHTKGPWRDSGEYDSHAGYWDTTIVGDGEDVDESFVAIVRSGNGREQVEANARLIAAAPELLAALKASMSALEAWMDQGKCLSIYQQASEAIAKAEGR